MIVLGRHRPLAHDAWSELAVRAAIEEIAADAIAHFDPDRFWPGHPSGDGEEDGDPSFYKGAAGVIWALDYLHRVGATCVAQDFRPVLAQPVAGALPHGLHLDWREARLGSDSAQWNRVPDAVQCAAP